MGRPRPIDRRPNRSGPGAARRPCPRDDPLPARLLPGRRGRAPRLARVGRGFADQARWFRGQRVQYVALPAADDRPAGPSGAVWADAIELESAAVPSARVAPGEAVRILLNWRTRAPAPDLKLSLRLQ